MVFVGWQVCWRGRSIANKSCSKTSLFFASCYAQQYRLYLPVGKAVTYNIVLSRWSKTTFWSIVLKLLLILKVQWDKTSVFSLLNPVNSVSVLFNCFSSGLMWYQANESSVRCDDVLVIMSLRVESARLFAFWQYFISQLSTEGLREFCFRLYTHVLFVSYGIPICFL